MPARERSPRLVVAVSNVRLPMLKLIVESTMSNRSISHPATRETSCTLPAWRSSRFSPKREQILGVENMSGSRPLVRILQGQLRGVIEKSINGKQYAAFKGIPYAKPPIGELRFRDPLPAEPWSHVMDTSKFGPSCAQLNQTTRKLTGGEDCLYLNVYTTSDVCSSASSPKPVMLWIHGGSFAFGSGNDTLFGPDFIIERDVVLVTINYRLNVLGFLNLEDEETTGNQGLKDQVFALKWVKENISKFGGDPDNVTIFGESSGGACVHYLTLSPLAAGLYHKAISQSGVALNPWAMSQKSPKVCAQELAAAFGKKSQDSKILLEFLKSIDAQKLAKMDLKISPEVTRQATLYFAPSIDTKSKNPFFPVSVKMSAKSGVKVPYLIGHTSHEGILYLTGMTDVLFKAVDSNIEMILSPRLLQFLSDKGITTADLKHIYFGDKPISYDTRFNFIQMLTDLQFVCGIHEVAQIQALTGSQTYLYNFSYDNGRSRIKTVCGLNDIPGACHTDEISYIFYPRGLERMGIPPLTSSSTDYLVAKRVAQMWTDFAKTGNPTPTVTDTVPVIWKPIKDGQSLECLNIGENLRMETVMNVNKRFVKTLNKS